MSQDGLSEHQTQARMWFEALQGRLIAAFEGIEREAPGPFAGTGAAPGTFSIEPWTRTDPDGASGGGGRTAILRGRVFEKAGIHFSAVHGRFPEEFAKKIPGAEADPSFWAAGVSLIAHPTNPNAPTAHMNTRFVVTSKAWFGGGGDLTPVLDRRRTQDDPDSKDFHAAFKGACDRHPACASYDRYKAWCDEYFYLKHRKEPRGIGGIFFDYLDTAKTGGPGFDADFAFVRDVGESFLSIYPKIVRRNWATPWTADDRRQQGIWRSRYVEFNLLYDRGTIFGLNTGGNVEAILSSMPPVANWP